MTTHAIILAAGKGTRLFPITHDIPKCLVKVNGVSILERALRNLSQSGITHVTIVTGYLQSKIWNMFGKQYLGMNIDYVTNYEYETTNSMFSLLIGLLHNCNESTWVIEGDILFDSKILQLQVHDEISWFVDSTLQNVDGAYLQTNASGYVTSLEIIRDLNMLQKGMCKSTGILHLSQESVERIIYWLGRSIAKKETNLYYDLILAQYLDQNRVKSVDVAPLQWYEIDTQEDLANAQGLFK